MSKFACMLVAIFAIALLLVRPLGAYMANVMEVGPPRAYWMETDGTSDRDVA